MFVISFCDFFFFNADVFSPDYMQVQTHIQIHVETHISYTITVVSLQLEICLSNI